MLSTFATSCFTWMLVVILTVNKQNRLVDIGQKWCKVHAWIGKKGEMLGAFVPFSPSVFFPWLWYSSTTVLAPTWFIRFVSQVVFGISCSFVMFFVSVMFVMVQGISIEGLVHFEKIVTDIYKMLQQICSKGMVKGIWYYFVLVIWFQSSKIYFQTVKYLALWKSFRNRLKCKKISVFLIIDCCAAANTSVHVHGCNQKFYST
jgi:hypothetical protein